MKKTDDEKDEEAKNTTSRSSNMADQMAGDALSSKTIVNYNGNSVDITNIDGNNSEKSIQQENKEAIHSALEQINGELGRKTEPVEKVEPKKEESESKDEKKDKSDDKVKTEEDKVKK